MLAAGNREYDFVILLEKKSILSSLYSLRLAISPDGSLILKANRPLCEPKKFRHRLLPL